ncbi:MAG: hypothetical protein ACO3A4_02835 [Silvanigrellaceae bacterium]
MIGFFQFMTPPKQENLKTIGTAVLTLLACVSASACNNSKTSDTRSVAKKSSNLLAQQVKGRISAEELDGATMRLNFFGASYFEVSRYKYPILSFSFPEKADYVQIIRCRADAKLGDLGTIEIGAANTQVADQKYKDTDYWKNISSTFGCVTIATSVSIDKFVDYFAGDGNWIYVSRACVQASRLPLDSTSATVSPCSRQVSKSGDLRGYVNKEQALSAERKSQLLAQRDKIDSLGRNIVYKAKQLDTEIGRCEAERGANRVSQKRRAAIGQLLGIGVGLGSKMIADKATQSIIGGLDVAGIFKDLSAQSADFLPPDYCPPADRLAKDIEIDKQQIELESESYQQSMKLFGEAP